ncbi:MAG: hypothetical protein FD123_1179 [Bacteroidetes bacterium]|nr:MAG: hypothetical protein FD123_1179 [Bacteroidota bacterium]
MNLLKTIGLFAGLAMLTTSCDYVSVPQQVGGTTGGGQDSGVTRVVLLEDYTGHFCPNCPRGAEAIDSIHTLFGDDVIAISIHAGDFAKPGPEYGLPVNYPPNSFPEDFRTTPGNEWNVYFGLFAYPLGMVNRVPNPTNTNLLNLNSEWATMVSLELAKAPTADLQIAPTYNSGTRTLNVTISGEMLQDTSGTFMIKTVLVEDSIYEWQVDNELTPDYTQYYHNHMLRGAVDFPNSGWGDQVLSGTIAATQSSFTKSYTYVVNNNWDDDHLYIVSFLYDDANKQILQAAKVKLK